jgi:hypothetical protein
MMASKFLYDEGVDEEVFNDEWANSGDVETEDVNQLELDFLSAIVSDAYSDIIVMSLCLVMFCFLLPSNF